MIPYLPQPHIAIWGTTFYAFGFLVALAIEAGWILMVWRAPRFCLERREVRRLTFHMLAWGYLGAHVLYWLLADRAGLVRRPSRLLNPLDGIYSFGGIACGLLAVMWFAHRYQLTRARFWGYLDLAAFVFPFSWTIARTGCALAHDHPGVPSTSWIAVRFPGEPRLDLGLIEMLFAAGLVGCFLLLSRREWPAPFYCGLFLFLYGPFRLWLDGLRDAPSAPDRLSGWSSLVLGGFLLMLAWRHRADPRDGASPHVKAP